MNTPKIAKFEVLCVIVETTGEKGIGEEAPNQMSITSANGLGSTEMSATRRALASAMAAVKGWIPQDLQIYGRKV